MIEETKLKCPICKENLTLFLVDNYMDGAYASLECNNLGQWFIFRINYPDLHIIKNEGSIRKEIIKKFKESFKQ